MKYNFDVTPDHRRNGSFRWDADGMPDDVIGMGTADQDFFCAPCIREAMKPVLEENCFNYRQHPQEYYDAVIEWYRRNYDLEAKREWISDIPGTIGAIRIALDLFVKKGDEVIIQTPEFGCLGKAIEGTGCRLLPNPMKIVDGHYEIDFEDFEEKVRTRHPSVFVLVNPQNPTGRVFTRAELERLVGICSEHGVKIISDEVHSIVLFEEHRHIPIMAVNETAQKIGVQVVSLSKGYNIMSLPHAIVMIADEEIRKKWQEQVTAHSFGYAVNSFAIAAVTSILKGEADEWQKELTAYLYKNMTDVVSFIEEHGLPLTPYKPEGGFLMWLDCREAGLGTEHLNKVFMERAHIDLDDGEESFGPEGRGFVRLNFAVTNKILHEALDRIGKMF